MFNSFVHCKEITYNQDKGDDIPRAIDNVRLPRNILESNGHDKREKQAGSKDISIVID